MALLRSGSEESSAPSYGGDVSLSPWALVDVLWRYRLPLLIIPAAVAVIVVGLTLASPRQYVATAKFVPQESRTSSDAGLGGLVGQLGLATGRNSTTSPQFYADLLLSREILRDVVRASYTLDGGRQGDLVSYFGLGGTDADDETARTVRHVRGLITSGADRNGVVSLEFRSNSPALSLAVAKLMLSLVNDYNLRRRQTQAQNERGFLEQRLAAARANLAEAENALTSFYGRNRELRSPMLQAENARLQREVNLRNQLYLSLSQSFEAARIEEVRSTPVVTVLERPDGFVAKQPKRTIQKGIVAGITATVLTIVLAFLVEFMRSTRRPRPVPSTADGQALAAAAGD